MGAGARVRVERDLREPEHGLLLPAKGGHLEVLRWLREHGCPWDHETRRRAAARGQLEVMRWLDEQGAP